MTTPLTLTPQDAAAILAAVDGTLAEGSAAVAALREYVAANPAPEWSEGTIAWVRSQWSECEWLMQRRGNRWFDGDDDGLTNEPGGRPYSIDDDVVTSVRPLRILGDDEVAVKRMDPDRSPAWWRVCAETLTLDGPVAALMRAYAAALDAEVSR